MKHLIKIIIALMFFATSAQAKNVGLSWDCNQDADYYKISWGTTPGVYDNTGDNITECSADVLIQDPVEDQVYYFVVKAYNIYGNSSDYSDEVSVIYGTRIPNKPTSLKAWWTVLVSWFHGIFEKIG